MQTMNNRSLVLRRTFMKWSSLILAQAACGRSAALGQSPVKVSDSRTNLSLRIAGVTRPFTFIHVADWHLCECDDRDSELRTFMRSRNNVFTQHGYGPPIETSANVIRRINASSPDIVIVGGDLIDVPTAANLELGSKLLDSIEPDFLFTIGNHEWIGSRIPHSMNRDYWMPVFDRWISHPTEFHARSMYGVNLVTLNHSAYENRITPDQLRQMREILAEGSPCIVFMHIPAPFEQPFGSPVTDTTQEFFKLLQAHPRVESIFVGHNHIEKQVEFRPGHFEYLVAPAFKEHFYQVRVIPAV